ncbi:MAG: hypothetical protein A2252_05790 [Elusimicrobia bacterium RIFOXYA2_FULL_39_19]|nr:MAG: hypothetical protein A2252_05790 [Elusimicrobia bacterium RIFOXYA2_FULL_39_19]
MNKNNLLRVINDQRRDLVDRDVVERDVFVDLEKTGKSKFIVIISGIRRCGKSTLLQQLRKKNQKSDYYMNFDDERLINFGLSDFQMLHELFIELYGEQDTFYFDEIQNIEGWERFVRRLHDEGKKVYITGSNASMLSKELGTHLTGRYVQVELFPFSFNEYLKYNKLSYDLRKSYNTNIKSVIRRYFSKYLKSGGMPEYIKTGNTDYLKRLYEGVLYRDIIARYKIASEKQIRELVYYSASNIGKEISFNSLKSVVGLGSSTTVKDYFGYLVNSYLIFLLEKYDLSLKKQIYSNKKVYFIDNAIADNIGFRFSEDKGRFYENLVCIELKRRKNEIYFHRGKNECDFVIKEGKKIVNVLQVCYSLDDKTIKTRELNGLAEAMKYYNLKRGLILTDDEYDDIGYTFEKVKYQLTIRPIWYWLLTGWV